MPLNIYLFLYWLIKKVESRMGSINNNSLLTSFAAGAVSGLTVDVSLFPLDTIKTRLQSKQGFTKAGGFKGIYKGLGPAALGSAPCAAIFFVTYDGMKKVLNRPHGDSWVPICHMASASCAEVAVNVVKVPVEIVKQRRQTTSGISPLTIARLAVQHEGFLGLYRGFCSTVLRDVPFSVIQFPIWEALKTHLAKVQGTEVTPAESALCGAIAGTIAGGFTTPLDVAKTRIMLAESSTVNQAQLKMLPVLLDIYRIEGTKGLFAGVAPRTAMIFLGGAVFFGSYEFARKHFISFEFDEKS